MITMMSSYCQKWAVFTLVYVSGIAKVLPSNAGKKDMKCSFNGSSKCCHLHLGQMMMYEFSEASMLKQCVMVFYTEVYVSTEIRTQSVQLIQNISFGGNKFASILCFKYFQKIFF